jgi:hypothetical protein
LALFINIIYCVENPYKIDITFLSRLVGFLMQAVWYTLCYILIQIISHVASFSSFLYINNALHTNGVHVPFIGFNGLLADDGGVVAVKVFFFYRLYIR